MPFSPVTHVIFDLDGTLLDTEVIYEKVISDIVQKYGSTYTAEARQKILGTKEQDIAAILVSFLQLQCNEKTFLKEYSERCSLVLSEAKLLPGVEKLIDHLHKHKIPIAIATSSSLKSVEVKSKNHRNFFAKFSHLVSGTDDPEVKQGKPQPDIFLVCASRFSDQPKPQNCLVFEDAPNGILGAHRAQMQSVWIPDAQVPITSSTHYTLLLNSMEKFDPTLFGLPPF